MTSADSLTAGAAVLAVVVVFSVALAGSFAVAFAVAAIHKNPAITHQGLHAMLGKSVICVGGVFVVFFCGFRLLVFGL